MGKLTEEIFNPSCCDGGETCLDDNSAQNCGCDKGANYKCEWHRNTYETAVNTTLAQWEEISKKVASNYEVRKFETGATRDTAEGKPEYAGFNSPLVEKAFGEYMNTHRVQPDGQLRESSNWKKGIPVSAYHQSLHRHYMDLWLHLEGYPEEAVDKDLVSILCALRFNINGLLLETLKDRGNDV